MFDELDEEEDDPSIPHLLGTPQLINQTISLSIHLSLSQKTTHLFPIFQGRNQSINPFLYPFIYPSIRRRPIYPPSSRDTTINQSNHFSIHPFFPLLEDDPSIPHSLGIPQSINHSVSLFIHLSIYKKTTNQFPILQGHHNQSIIPSLYSSIYPSIRRRPINSPFSRDTTINQSNCFFIHQFIHLLENDPSIPHLLGT